MDKSLIKKDEDVIVVYPFSFSMLDYPDDESFAVSIYFLGCNHLCEDCHNKTYKYYDVNLPNVKKFKYPEFEYKLKDSLKRYRTNKCVLLGGDPLFKHNLSVTKKLINDNPDIDFMIYTGHNINYVKENKVNGFTFIKCGLYDKSCKQNSEKTNDYFQLSSTNQKLYDSNLQLLSKNGKYFFKKEEIISV